MKTILEYYIQKTANNGAATQQKPVKKPKVDPVKQNLQNRKDVTKQPTAQKKTKATSNFLKNRKNLLMNYPG